MVIHMIFEKVQEIGRVSTKTFYIRTYRHRVNEMVNTNFQKIHEDISTRFTNLPMEGSGWKLIKIEEIDILSYKHEKNIKPNKTVKFGKYVEWLRNLYGIKNIVNIGT